MAPKADGWHHHEPRHTTPYRVSEIEPVFSGRQCAHGPWLIGRLGREADRSVASSWRCGRIANAEHRCTISQRGDFAAQIARSGGGLFHHRGILLRRLVHRANRRTDLGDRGRLRLIVGCDFVQQALHDGYVGRDILQRAVDFLPILPL